MNKESVSGSFTSRRLIGFVPSSVGILLALVVFVAFPSSSLADQCAVVEYEETGYCCAHPIYVSLSTATSGATIFVTWRTDTAPAATPTHNGSTPTGQTSTWVGPFFNVPPGGRLYIKALAYKAGFTDSDITEYSVENY
jgi:hypothetical protein